MKLEIVNSIALSVLTATQAIVSLFAVRAARRQASESGRTAVELHFTFAAQLIASNPRVRCLFYDNEQSRLISPEALTPEEWQVAALVAEAFGDAFEAAISSDKLTRANFNDDQYYGYFRRRMMGESPFFRKFIIDREDQYDQSLRAEALAIHSR